MRECNYYGKILHSLHNLKQIYPSYSMGKHLSTILDDFGDIWGITDKELSTAIIKYTKQLSLDKPHSCNDIDRIIDEGLHLNKILIDNDDVPYNEEEY